MSAQDAGFFFADDQNTPMHVGSVAVFDGPPPRYGDLVRLLAAKLPDVPRYRQRVRTVPLHLGRPVWTDDEHFEILYHVRHTAVPAPGGAEQLRNLAGRIFGQRLDLAKPLWEMWLVEGLQGGRWALISKTHHCMIDGVAGWDLAAALLDAHPDAAAPPARPWTPAPPPSSAWLVLDGLRDSIAAPLQQLGRVPALARHLPTLLELLDFGRGLPSNARRLVSPAARSLNGPTGPHRRWEWAQASLGEVKQVRKAFGGTVNDVALAAVIRGFRDLLDGRGDLSDNHVVRSMVPVSVRAEHEQGTLNNRVSAVLVNLPVSEPDPLRRLESLRAQMDDLKDSRQAVGAQALTELAGFAAPTLLALGTRLAFRFPQPLMQTVTTNVPGPRVPLYLLGRKMVEIHPYVPIATNMRVSIGIFSYLDQLNFGINTDLDTVPDIRVLSEGIRAGFDELVALASSGAAVAEAAGSRAASGSVASKRTASKTVASKTVAPKTVAPKAAASGSRPSKRTAAKTVAAKTVAAKAAASKTVASKTASRKAASTTAPAEPAAPSHASTEPTPPSRATAEPTPPSRATAEPAPPSHATAEPAPPSHATAEPTPPSHATAEPTPPSRAAAGSAGSGATGRRAAGRRPAVTGRRSAGTR
jgi:diacylglycerol O-acyltransferase / wax synthase